MAELMLKKLKKLLNNLSIGHPAQMTHGQHGDQRSHSPEIQ